MGLPTLPGGKKLHFTAVLSFFATLIYTIYCIISWLVFGKEIRVIEEYLHLPHLPIPADCYMPFCFGLIFLLAFYLTYRKYRPYAFIFLGGYFKNLNWTRSFSEEICESEIFTSLMTGILAVKKVEVHYWNNKRKFGWFLDRIRKCLKVFVYPGWPRDLSYFISIFVCIWVVVNEMSGIISRNLLVAFSILLAQKHVKTTGQESSYSRLEQPEPLKIIEKSIDGIDLSKVCRCKMTILKDSRLLEKELLEDKGLLRSILYLLSRICDEEWGVKGIATKY